MIADILTIIEAIRKKHPEATKPDPSGEPPWHKMYGDAEDDDPDIEGNMTCPKCNAVLHYRISGYNGHVWAKCPTVNCIAFMQ